MTLPRYQELKDSGIDYLGAVPNAWSLKRLGDIVAFAQGKAHEPYIDDDGDFICVNSRFVSTAGKAFKNCTVNLTPASLDDILMVMSDLPNGRALARAYYVRENGKYAVNQRVCRITAEKAESGFLFYLLDRHPGLMKNDDGVHQTHLSNDDFLKLKLYLPSLSEQTQIARFLDHETARIDALIEEQQRLIELLKEKRQAVISHAVTKGLDPTVPMKDSGVEWLGEVPAHWDVLNFNLLVYIAEGQVNPRVQPYSEMLLIAPNHVESGTGRLIHTETAEEQGADSGKYVCQKGDVIYSKIRPALRKVCLAPEACLCSADMYPMRGVSGLDNEYLFWFILSEPFSAFALLESDRVAMPKINRESLGGLKLARPPLEEQKAISEFLVRETLRIDALIDEANSGVGLLNERRSALISAAVTGKIDVRDWLPPASAQAPESAVAEAV